MARGSIVKRCLVCRRNGQTGLSPCAHREAIYSIVYRAENNRQKWETVGPNKKEAEKRLAEINAQLNSGTFHQPTEILFEDFAAKWLEQYAKSAVKISTFKSYSNTIRVQLLPVFKGFPIHKISIESIQRFIAGSLKERKPKTVNNALILLKTMFKYARRWKYIRENPALDVDNVPLEPQEMDFLKPDEVRKFLQYAREPFKVLFLTAILTGMRRGELLGLQWGDIDWQSNTIFIRRSLYWMSQNEVAAEGEVRFRFVSPKSKRSVRALFMSPKLKEALELYRMACPVSKYDLVFCNKEGNPLDPDNMVKREFLPTLVAAGLRKIRFHDLRHTYTALLVSQGENIKFIQSQLGHASIQTTLDRYGHLLPSVQQGVGARIDNLVFNSSSPVQNTSLQPSCNLLARC